MPEAKKEIKDGLMNKKIENIGMNLNQHYHIIYLSFHIKNKNRTKVMIENCI